MGKKERFRSATLGDLHNRRSEMRRIDSDLLFGSYYQLLDRIANIESSPFYWYLLDTDAHGEDYPFIGANVVAFYFKDAESDSFNFGETQDELTALGKALFGQSLATDELLKVGSQILSWSYQLGKNYLTINSAPASLPKGSSNFSGIQQIKLKKFAAEIGTKKPEEFREAMRRFMPRWQTLPLSLPSKFLNEEAQSLVNDLWAEFPSSNPALLTHPSELAQQRAPLHVHFKLADQLENRGENYLAYALKTTAIIQLLTAETERAQLDNPELPFFKYVAAKLLVSNRTRLPRHVYFDFESAFYATMRQTLLQLSDELNYGRPGIAAGFLEELARIYPDSIGELLAQIILMHSQSSDDLTMVGLAGALSTSRLSFAATTLHYLEAAEDRPFLGAAEIEAALAELPQLTLSSETFQELKANSAIILEEEDSYRFRTSLADLQIDTNFNYGSVDIELDALSQEVVVLVALDSNIGRRTLSFQLEIGPEQPQLTLTDIDQALDSATRTLLTQLVYLAIETEIKRFKARQLQTNFSSQRTESAPQIQPESNHLTREQRKQQYAQGKKELKRKQQARSSEQKLETVIEQLNPELESWQENRTIVGLETKYVDGLLEEAGITTLTAEQVIKKLIKTVEMANISKKMLGKKINTDHFLDRLKSSEHVNLRQVNWLLDGGSTAIRVYLEDTKQSEFVLRGILNKKGLSQQDRYIAKVVDTILKERQENS